MNIRAFLILNPRLLTLVGIFALSTALFFFSLGIIEASYLNTHNDNNAEYTCWEVRLNIILVCVINFLSTFALIPTIMEIYYGDITKGILVEYMSVLLISRIWTCIIFFGIPDSCAENYRDNFPKLLTFIKIESCVLFTLCVITIFGLFANCCLNFERNEKQVIPTSNQIDPELGNIVA